jgi:hypothetical protein
MIAIAAAPIPSPRCRMVLVMSFSFDAIAIGRPVGTYAVFIGPDERGGTVDRA